jgi:spore germination protein YaaH/PKD repeat protein
MRSVIFRFYIYAIACSIFLLSALSINSPFVLAADWDEETVLSDTPWKGIHQAQEEEFGAKALATRSLVTQNLKPLSLSATATPGVKRIVFGYLPYWEDTNTKIDWLPYNLITHIAWHSVSINDSGSISNSAGWPNTYLINKAHANGVKVLLSATKFSNGSTFLANASARYTSITALRTLVSNAGADGVTIDIEAVPYSATSRANLSAYMHDLATTFHNYNSNYHVSIATEPTNSLFDYDSLSDYLDSIFVMWYNFYYSGSAYTGPNAPLSHGSYYPSGYGLIGKVNTWLQSNNFRPNKIIIGLPSYGLQWGTLSAQPHAATLSGTYDSVISGMLDSADASTKAWDTASQTSWYYSWTGSTCYQTWYESPESLGYKCDLINNYGLGGVGFWAFAYDYPRKDYWSVISTKFYGIDTAPRGIANGNFDNTRSNWVNWEYGNDYMTIGKGTASYQGGSAVAITQTQGSGQAFYQTDGRIKPGETWTISAWAYQNGFATASCNIGWAGSYSPYTKSPNNALIPAGGGWKHYYITQNFTNTTTGFRDVQATLTGAGTVYLDDVKVFKGVPGAAFYASVTEGVGPLSVSFYDQSTDAVSWSWDFGDGATASSQNPSHTYSPTAESWYTVRLIVNHSYGASTMTRSNYIHVVPVFYQNNFTAASDTSLYAYEISEGKTALPQIGWLSTLDGATGVESFTFANSSQGPANGLSPAVYIYNGIPPAAFDIAAYAVPYNMSTAWSWLQVYFRSIGSTKEMYPQMVFQNGSGTGTIYLDSIRILQQQPHTMTFFVYPGGDFGSANDTSYWAYENPQSGVAKGSFSIVTGTQVAYFSGSQDEGIKMTMSTTAGKTYTLPANVGKSVGLTLKAAPTGDTSGLFFLMAGYGVTQAGAADILDLGATASFGRMPVPHNNLYWNCYVTDKPYMYGQIIMKNSKAGSLAIDDVDPIYE